MTIEKERELFNKWYSKKPKGWFEAVRYNTAWGAWLASTNREGYKLVPVDSLKEIIDCAYCHIYDRCIGGEGDDVIKHILAMGVEDDH